MSSLVSVIIPNRNGGATLGKCLEAIFASEFDSFEVIVVDDCSSDDSVKIAEGFPCKLVKLEKHSGTSMARNIGVSNSTGEIIFFTDSDCLLEKDAILIAEKTLRMEGPAMILGGTYTKEPSDEGFFNRFQSIFINYFETKRPDNPDYIAAHAMAMYVSTFKRNNGFLKDFLPILEDVEFSHRLKRSGYRLVLEPKLQVQHIFNFTLMRSLKNAWNKSMNWTIYSIWNKDFLSDSGTASKELKLNGVSLIAVLALMLTSLYSANLDFIYPLFLIILINALVSRKLFYAFYKTGGFGFSIIAMFYYSTAYAMAALVGAMAGMLKYRLEKNKLDSME